MRSFKLLAAVAVASALVAGPALARDGRGYHRHGGFGPGAIAAGIAIGAAGAIASAPYRDSYAYYGDEYAAPGGYYGPSYGYSRGSRTGQTWNSTAGAGGYNTDATRLDYNNW
jgi:hypothetical protein